MTETYGDKLLRGVVPKWTAWYRILRLSHGPKWPVVLEYIKLKKWIKSPKLQPGRPGKQEKKRKIPSPAETPRRNSEHHYLRQT
jgi:hypothetical protein